MGQKPLHNKKHERQYFMQTKFKPVLGLGALAAVLTLSACGETDVERALTGAAVGAVAADLTENDPLVGAAVGAGVGAYSDNLRSYAGY
tara:strand:+ start:1428 stop:1694 length:267 start_codon:yes stop_codon:yes gene_type:complete